MVIRDKIITKNLEDAIQKKPHINTIFIGHIDHGKSTLVGRLVLDTGHIPHTLVDKYKKEGETKGKESFALAFVMDSLKEERERGITIEVGYIPLYTNKFNFTLIDAPGHWDYVKNMITGASQADSAVLVVDVNEGIQEQTDEHLYISKSLGIKELIVAINKMDASTPRYSKERFNEVQKETITFLKKHNIDINKISIIPTSGLIGDNVVKKGDTLSWYDGPTLLEALNDFTEPIRLIKLPLRIPIEKVYSIKGVGTVASGKIETGMLTIGDKIVFNPSGKIGRVKSIKMSNELITNGRSGDNLGFCITDLNKNDIRRGYVAGHLESPPTIAKKFLAKIAIEIHPSVIKAGYTPVFHAHTSDVSCIIEEILQKLDPKTGEITEENPLFISSGDTAIVKIKPTRPLVIESVKKIPQLGRFIIRDFGRTIGSGLCLKILEKKDE